MDEIKAGFQFTDHKINKLIVNNSLVGISEEMALQLSLAFKPCPAKKANKDGLYLGRLKLLIETSGQDPVREGKGISIELEVEGLFCASEDAMDISVFNKMLAINGLATLYSIARSIIISISAQCCTSGQMRIPMLDMVEVYKASTEKAQVDSAGEHEQGESQSLSGFTNDQLG